MTVKNPTIRTKRLLLRPMHAAALAALCEQTQDEPLRQAYEQMLAGSRAHPQESLWYLPWEIILRDDATRVGSIGFHGQPAQGAVELGYGVDAPFVSQGYATEAAMGLIRWALAQKGVYFIEAEVDDGNAASLRVLEKLGFAPAGTGAEGARYMLARPASSNFAVFLLLGITCGVFLGLLLDRLLPCSGAGMAVGLLLGILLDRADRKKRTALWCLRKAANESSGATPVR